MRMVSYLIIGLLFTGSPHLSAQILYTATELGILGYPIPYPVFYGLNNAGQVVGQDGTAGGRLTRAVLWQNGAGPQDLGSLGGAMNSAFEINDAGQVVGSSETDNSGSHQTHAFLWQSGTGIQ